MTLECGINLHFIELLTKLVQLCDACKPTHFSLVSYTGARILEFLLSLIYRTDLMHRLAASRRA